MRSRTFWTKALVCVAVASVTASTSVFAGDVILTRRSTGNWHQVGRTDLEIGMTWLNVNDAESDDIPDGIPSVIAPLTAAGEQSYSDGYNSADVFYTGELAGTYDHQNVIDHAMNATFAAILDTYSPGTGITVQMLHYSDEVTGSLDVAIDGDNIQFLKVDFGMEWEAGGVLSGASGFGAFTNFPLYDVDIIVYRNGYPIIWINGDQNGVGAISMDGFDHDPVGGASTYGDWELGSVSIDDDEPFGLWAADGDVIEYTITIGYEYDAGLGNINNPGPYHAHYEATGLMDWRFSIEDSHLH